MRGPPTNVQLHQTTNLVDSLAYLLFIGERELAVHPARGQRSGGIPGAFRSPRSNAMKKKEEPIHAIAAMTCSQRAAVLTELVLELGKPH